MAELSPLFSWRAAITESGLPPMTRLVAFALSLHMNERGGSCFPSQARLAHETGLNEQTVKRHLRQLREAGWLTVKLRKGTTPLYTATVPLASEFTDPGTQDTGVSSAPPQADPGIETTGGSGTESTGGGVSKRPPRTSLRTTDEDDPPKPPRGGPSDLPDPSCTYCEGTGVFQDKPCGCSRAPNRKPRQRRRRRESVS